MRIENNQSEIYGNGFRDAILSLMNGWKFSKLIEFAIKNKQFPKMNFQEFSEQENEKINNQTSLTKVILIETILYNILSRK